VDPSGRGLEDGAVPLSIWNLFYFPAQFSAAPPRFSPQQQSQQGKRAGEENRQQRRKSLAISAGKVLSSN